MNKFTRSAALLAALLIALPLSACGEEPVSHDEKDPVTTTAAETNAPLPPEDPDVWGLTVGETFLYPGADPASVLAQLGEPYDMLEAASCVHDGFDRVYYYAGYEINTQPTASGGEVITSIYLVDDSIATDEGLRIGDTLDAVLQLYGEVSADAGVYTYSKTDSGVTASIHIAVDAAGYVTSIYYS